MICIQVLYTECWKELAKIVVPNVVNYCRKHGYSWNIQFINKEPFDAYEKVIQIKKCFESNECDAVWSLDCDALITNYNKKIEDYLDDEHDLFICKMVGVGINAGSFVIKKSEWSLKLLDYLLERKGEEGMYGEQDAMNKYISEFPNENKIKYLPHPSINSLAMYLYPEFVDDYKGVENAVWEDGCFVLHLPGQKLDLRLEIFKSTGVII